MARLLCSVTPSNPPSCDPIRNNRRGQAFFIAIHISKCPMDGPDSAENGFNCFYFRLHLTLLQRKYSSLFPQLSARDSTTPSFSCNLASGDVALSDPDYIKRAVFPPTYNDMLLHTDQANPSRHTIYLGWRRSRSDCSNGSTENAQETLLDLWYHGRVAIAIHFQHIDAKCALQSPCCFRRNRHLPRKPGKEGNPWRYATCDQLGGNWRLCNELYLIWTISETGCVSECALHRHRIPDCDQITLIPYYALQCLSPT